MAASRVSGRLIKLFITRDDSRSLRTVASTLVKGRSSTGHGDWIRVTDRKRLGDVLWER